MGPGMKARGLQFGSDVAERLSPRIAERHRSPADQSIDIEHPKPDAFHVERPNRDEQGAALIQKGLARCASRLCLDI